ncbi:DJ-1/PfpI family protein [Clostridium sp. CCUG 7971]|uniref:DJ-1/PfpI family protein n=1 Tax=Clostridium sp. CCUG 7971 TaxID=2811414 RepID=UPI001ABB25F6|nr:DJ-1/PfpI family protein [Clostridium sp. CCUG 7971]MBO3446289.1 DJ-1/PfpI family protein [Clostridium sp. CCUG 7971]
MKKVIYIYILDTMADWEIGYILQAIGMEKILNKGTTKFYIKTVGVNKNSVKTLGGLTIIPDCSLDEINEDEMVAILLPGADRWIADDQKLIVGKLTSYIDKGILVAAICGATIALSDLGILNNYLHTSNSLEYLCEFSGNYKGQDFYKNELSVTDKNIITASSAGGLLWAKQILEYLNVYSNTTIEAWYKYYLTGNSKYYLELLSSIE